MDWGSLNSRLEPLWGGSLLFTTKFPEIPGTHFMDVGSMNSWVDFGPPSGFEHETPRLGNQRNVAVCWIILNILFSYLEEYKSKFLLSISVCLGMFYVNWTNQAQRKNTKMV